MNKNKFKEIEHTADVGIIANGKNLDKMFENAAYGMLNILHGKKSFRANKTSKVVLHETSDVNLLVSWLNEINYLILVKNFLTVKVNQLHIKQNKNSWNLNAVLSGTESFKHFDKFDTEIKAVTYHQLKIERINTGFQCQVIFDI